VVSTGLFGITRVRRSVILLDWVATIMLVGGIRTLWRSGRRRDRREDDER
jgi:FlaA1/EpsC-like NDP-sugar epimerase